MLISRCLTAAALVLASAPAFAEAHGSGPDTLSYGVRPAFLIDKMEDSALKTELQACLGQTPQQSKFSIGHRGAPLQFPEHTVEANVAAARMGAGILECDVTFTSDLELVCRHAQNDLHTTTNILATDLAGTCATPFTAAAGETEATAECRTSEITLAEFRTLTPKMDAANSAATTVEAYMDATAGWRTDLYTVDSANLLTHAESIAMFKELGVKMTPELKDPSVDMPHDGFTMEDYATKMIDEYRAADVPASDVFPQSFNLDVIMHWLETEPEYGQQAVFLVEPDDSFDGQDASTWKQDFAALREAGLNYLAPSMNMLVTAGEGGAIEASAYAKAAKEAGLTLISWSLERSGPLTSGGGWYYLPLNDVVSTDGQMYELVDALAQDVGIVGLFSDWPGTVSYYASCMGLE